MNKLITVFLILISFLVKVESVSASFYVAGESANLKRKDTDQIKADYRVFVLEAYLESHNSPLAEHAEVFVQEADANGLDWRLVPAISGVESTFGKRIPYNSYNAYGWANGKYKFNSWDQSIEVVSTTLNEKYINNGAVTLSQIARRYAPPSSTWEFGVRFFMDKIDPIPLNFTLEG